MKLLRILLIILLILAPIPFGIYLVNTFFYESSKSHLFYGDILINEVPPDYYPQKDGFWFTLPEGTCAGMKMFYRDITVGTGSPNHTVVFVHGNPSSSYTFRKTIDQLLQRTKSTIRLISMDHIGFGLSDRARSILTPQDHADNLLQLFNRLNAENITLVLHDWGGPIGIGAFLNIPEKIDSLILINTIAFTIPDPEFITDKYPIHIFDNDAYFKILPDALYGKQAAFNILCPPSTGFFQKIGLINRILFPGKASSKNDISATAIKFFSNHLQTPQNIENSQFLYDQARILPREHRNRIESRASDTEKLFSFIEENIPATWGERGRRIPVYGIFGELDILSNDMFALRWKEFLPQLEGCIDVIHNTGHHIQEEKPDIVASYIMRAMYRLKDTPSFSQAHSSVSGE